MKILLFAMILIFSSVCVSAQTACGDLAAQPGKWVQTPPTGKDVLGLKNINTAMSLFQKSVSGFKGGQANTYTFTADWVDTRPYKYQGYTVAMNFLTFECIGGKVKPQSATGTWAYIGFNDFPFFKANNVAGQGSEFFRLPNGQQMYLSKFKLDGNYKGMDRLVPLIHAEATAVFLSKAGTLPLRAVSQAEVLNSYRKFFTTKKDVEINRLESIVAKEKADLARIDNDRYITDKEASKKAIIEGNNRSRGYIAQFRKELSDCVATIDSYSTRPAARQPAYVEGIDEYCNPEKMFLSSNAPNAKQVVVFDENYFDKSLPSMSPQFIVVYWRNEDANHMLSPGQFRFPVKREFMRLFEENFDFSTLQNMLGK